MTEQEHNNKISEVIQKTIEEDFAGIKILKVRIMDTSIYDEEDEFRVEVVFDGKPKDFGGFSGVVRHVRPKLHEVDEDRFPIFFFVNSNDVTEGAALATS